MDFFFFPLKEASPGYPGACGVRGGGLPSPLPHSSPHCAVGLGAPGEREDLKCKVVVGGGGGYLPSLEGGARKDSPCPKLHQHPRSLTHTSLKQKTPTYIA